MAAKKTASERLAKTISYFIFPPLLSVVAIAAFAPSLMMAVFAIFFLTLAPLGPVVLKVRKGKVDIFVTNAKDRNKFYFSGFLLASFVYMVSLVVGASPLAIYALSYAASVMAVAVVNMKWKISAHTAAIAGPATAVGYVLGWPGHVIWLLALPVGWARWKLKAHTLGQIVAGPVVSALTTLAVYSIAA
jgi:hypothetical protein